MSLLGDLDDALASQRPHCKLCDVLADLPELEADALRGALAGTLGGKRISVILKRNGHDVGLPTVHAHRSGGHQ